MGVEFWDVGCVRISFAVNSNLFPTHFHWKSNAPFWNPPKVYGSVSLIQPLDSRRVTFAKHLRVCPGGQCAECVVKKWLTSFFICCSLIWYHIKIWCTNFSIRVYVPYFRPKLFRWNWRNTDFVFKTPGMCFSENKTARLHHIEPQSGDAATNCFYQNPNIQICRYPDIHILALIRMLAESDMAADS